MPRPALTPRQTQILRAYANGKQDTAIATELHLGVETIRSHTKTARLKLGAHTIAQAVAKAYEHGLLP